MKELSYVDKAKLPYSLLLDHDTLQAAAYTNNHEAITYSASEALIAYALAHTERCVPFDTVAHAQGLPRWRPLPPWATPEVQKRLVLIWVRRPEQEAPDSDWLAIPRC